MVRNIKKTILVGLLFYFLFTVKTFAVEAPTETLRSQVLTYIDQTWDNLTRRNSEIVFSKLDPKVISKKLYIYLPQDEDINKVSKEITANLSPNVKETIEINYLPDDISQFKQHGLLYLPHPYVVPGGRFNEMYGWDSFFISLGLSNANRMQMVRWMIDNLIYEINHYGTILNANRTYDLQRSQPPLLTEMILSYYKKTHDKVWLASTLPAINKLYQFWMTPPHLVPEIGLSRYYAGGNGPAPEESPIYYQRVVEYFKKNNLRDYDVKLYFNAETGTLTPLFYIVDRTVRESGLDISAKYGPFGIGILDFIPVDLNVFLYQLEKDASEIYKILKDTKSSKEWAARAKKRADLINNYLWDDSLGYYFDYNFKTKSLRPYVYATTYYPLWAGIATKEQAQQLVDNLPNLLAKGGLVTSTYQAKTQWDAPFSWAPFQYFAIEGLDRYGYHALAKNLAARFVNTVEKGFEETHQLYEKYDVQQATVETTKKINYGYNTNEIGFGWTNGVYSELLKYLN